MLFKVCKLKYFNLLFIILLTYVKLDLPIHTLTKDVIGIWKIYETELYDKFQNCGSTYPNKNIENLKIDNFKEYLQEIYGELYVKFIELSDERFFNRTLLYPRNTWSYFTIKNPLNNQILGNWTLVYDEGVMIDINDKNYFGYFKYNNIKNNECKQITQNIEDEYGNIKCYVTDSNRLQIGWYSKKNNNNYKFGCFYMEKLKYNNNKNYIIDLTFNTKHNELEFSTPTEFSPNFPSNNTNSPINPINKNMIWKNKLDIGLDKLGIGLDKLGIGLNKFDIGLDKFDIGYENISPLRFIQLCKGVNYQVINNFNSSVTVTGPPNSTNSNTTGTSNSTNNSNKDTTNTLTTSTNNTTIPPLGPSTVTEGKGANSTAMECTSEKNPNEIAAVTNTRGLGTFVDTKGADGTRFESHSSTTTGCRRPDTVTEKSFPNNWTWGDPFNGLEEDIYTTSQGECGSCYIYSSLYVISKRYQILFKKLYPNYNWKLKQFQLSINDILTSPYSQGCYGGFLMLVGKHIKEFGIQSDIRIEQNNQFEQIEQFEELNDQNDNKWYIENYGYVGGCYECTNEINMMNEIITNGPIAVAIYSPIQLFYYTNGIFNNNYKHGIICDLPYNNLNGWEYTNHAIIIVGWGIEIINEEKIKYWICKNTWGKNWGIEGYFKIKKGINLCGIESQAVYFDPTLIKGLSKKLIEFYNKTIK